MSLPPFSGTTTPESEPPPGSVVGEGVANAIELKEVAGLSQGQIVRRRFFRHRGALVAMTVLGFVVVFAYTSVGAFGIGGWWKWTKDDKGDIVNETHPTMDLELPLWLGGNGWSGVSLGEHPLGQDRVGYDVFALTMSGVQTSINVMVVLALVAGVLGVVIGAFAGYFRGWLDQALMRFTDLFITFPVLVIGAVLGVAVQGGGAMALAIALGLISWTTLARLVRGEFLALREREFVDAARVAGASHRRIMFKHMLPNAMGVIIVNTTLLMSTSVILETSLSFLGFGIKSPDVSLGLLISQYQSAFNTRPWLFWFPATFLITIALTVNFIGDGLRDAFDPRQRRVPSERAMARAASKAEKLDQREVSS